MPPQQVEIVSVSGDALDWLRYMALAQLALGLVIVALLVAVCVVVFWRGG